MHEEHVSIAGQQVASCHVHQLWLQDLWSRMLCSLFFPGYAFLLFRDEMAVHRLAKMCIAEEGKLFMFVSSVTQTHKKVRHSLEPIKLAHSVC